MAIDPVCGMTVDPARAAGSVAHNGTTYYFCSKHCVEKFRAAPEKYLAGHREAMGPALVNIGLGAAPKPRTVHAAWRPRCWAKLACHHLQSQGLDAAYAGSNATRRGSAS